MQNRADQIETVANSPAPRTWARVERFTDLVDEDAVTAELPFVTATLLGRWRRAGRIRCFEPQSRKRVYLRQDILAVIEEELTCEEANPHSNTGDNGSGKSQDGLDGIDTGTMTDAERRHAEHSRQKLLSGRKTS